MRIIAIGDVMGKAGRRSLSHLLPKARDKYHPDVVIANGENAAGGFGLTQKVFKQFTEDFGIDCVTTGNHWADKPEIHDFYRQTDRLLLPANMMNVREERDGLKVLKAKNGVAFAVINLTGKIFMNPQNRCPFTAADRLLAEVPERVKIRIIDMHAEATSEKQGIGRYLSGRTSLVFGTHSHVPTADERILDGKTGFITDLGMTGPYESVIGIRAEAAITRMMTGEKKKFEPAEKDLWFCFIVADIDPETGHCLKIERCRWHLDDFVPRPS